ncbi:hypothetical protein KY285_023869 [Solanum tuberosum]|nr:hypothetical protein KY289_024200 [Solanum tuberosum]KAH0676068.1 hypothetical protein KY285_023869 [Solanum tuberosum]
MKLRGPANAENKKFTLCKCGKNPLKVKARDARGPRMWSCPRESVSQGPNPLETWPGPHEGGDQLSWSPQTRPKARESEDQIWLALTDA